MSHFIKELSAFAQAADLIDNESCDTAFNGINTYFNERFNAGFWELLRPQKNRDSEINLSIIRGSCNLTEKGTEFAPGLVYDRDGRPAGQSAYCYLMGKPMWITSSSEQRLLGASDYQNEWNEIGDIPAYKEFSGNTCETKTSILVPFDIEAERFVLNIESSELFIYTNAIGRELQQLCGALSNILAKNSLYNKDIKGSKEVTRKLEILAGEEIPYGPIPVFIASSGRAEDDVMGAMQTVLDSYGDAFKIEFWRTDETSGDVRQAILKNLHLSRLGLCYLSEPASQEGKYQYQDNPNVLFESGFLHASTFSGPGHAAAWIPIREASSPKAPFDISGERLIVIERDRKSKLNREAFFRDLKARLDKILESLE